jgi:hypothetical protein
MLSTALSFYNSASLKMPVQQTSTPKQPGNWQRPGAPPPPNERPRALNNLDRFWQRVSAGLELTELWSQFKRDAQSGYKFYQRDFDLEETAGQSRGSRPPAAAERRSSF